MGRWLPSLLLLAAVAGGVWLLTSGRDAAPEDGEAPPEPVLGPRAPALPHGEEQLVAQGGAPRAGARRGRIGVLSPEDRTIPVDPRGTPLAQIEILLPAAGPEGITGDQLLMALAEPFLVRVRHEEDLAALRAERFPWEGGRRMPLPVVAAVLQERGYSVSGSDGRVVLVLGRFSPEERARGGGQGPGMAWQGGAPRPLPGPGPGGSSQEQPQDGAR